MRQLLYLEMVGLWFPELSRSIDGSNLVKIAPRLTIVLGTLGRLLYLQQNISSYSFGFIYGNAPGTDEYEQWPVTKMKTSYTR